MPSFICQQTSWLRFFLTAVSPIVVSSAQAQLAPTQLPAITVEKPAETTRRPARRPHPRSTSATMLRVHPIAQRATQPPPPRATALPVRPSPTRSSAAPATATTTPGSPAAEIRSATPTRITAAPAGQVQTDVGADRTRDTRAFSAADLLLDSPGITVKQGNGPRDFGISIRGSNARNGFGIRNVVIFDDGFPVTQPDGLSRSDLIDPHAYADVNVVRGPSSALYGNYATGGAVDFRTFSGRVINGVELGTDAGSYGYLNNYLLYGHAVAGDPTTGAGSGETFVFASDVKGDSLTSHSAFNTQTSNALIRYQPTPDDRVVLKLIENHLRTNLSDRLSLNNFFLNPYQRGCGNAAANVPGCQNVTLLANGFNGTTTTQSADQGGFGRNDNRFIAGARWEHDFGAAITWRNQVTFDNRSIDQPTGATSAIGDYPSVNLISDVVAHGQVFGFEAASYAALFLNTLSNPSYTYNVAPGGNATLGGLASVLQATQANAGGRAREEIKLTDTLLLVAGVGVEHSSLKGASTTYGYSAPNVVSTVTPVNAERDFLNTAPELSLTYKPTTQWQVTGRVATGYGTPSVSNLFVTAAGVPGNNTTLKSQSNLGTDLLVSYVPLPLLTFSVDGFYEFFRNEMITQSPGVGLMSFTFNAPRSVHRGVEVGAKWAFAHGFSLTTAYTYDNQVYTQFAEQLGVGNQATAFNRAGNRIPGVPSNELLVRLGYDVAVGVLRGFGAYAEYVLQGDNFIDNANLVKVPGFGIANVNLHYARPVVDGAFREIQAYVEVRNVANTTYVASANNVSDAANSTAASIAAASGSIYAGTPRTVYGGLRVKF